MEEGIKGFAKPLAQQGTTGINVDGIVSAVNINRARMYRQESRAEKLHPTDPSFECQKRAISKLVGEIEADYDVFAHALGLCGLAIELMTLDNGKQRVSRVYGNDGQVLYEAE